MNEVFISYSSKDEKIAVLLYETLKKGNIKPWMALYDIDYGSNYAKEIFGAIENAKVFSVIISANSCESDHVKNEIELATRQIKNGMIIMPIRIDHNDIDEELQYYLARKQWLDASNPPIQEKINRYCDQIDSVLNNNLTGKQAFTDSNEEISGSSIDTSDNNIVNETSENYKKYALAGDFDKAIQLLEIELKRLNELKESKCICQRCGKQNEEDTIFCSCCGNSLLLAEKSDGESAVCYAKNEKKASHVFFAGIINRSGKKRFSKKTLDCKKQVKENQLKTEIEVCLKYNQLGFYYKQIGNFTKALETFKTALTYVSEHAEPSIHENIASTYIDLEEYDKAIEEYTQALTLQRVVFGVHSGDTLLARSNAFYKIGKDDLALKDYKEAMKKE